MNAIAMAMPCSNRDGSTHTVAATTAAISHQLEGGHAGRSIDGHRADTLRLLISAPWDAWASTAAHAAATSMPIMPARSNRDIARNPIASAGINEPSM